MRLFRFPLSQYCLDYKFSRDFVNLNAGRQHAPLDFLTAGKGYYSKLA